MLKIHDLSVACALINFKYKSPHLPANTFQDSSGCLKPWKVPNSIYTVFSYIYIPMIKFNL